MSRSERRAQKRMLRALVNVGPWGMCCPDSYLLKHLFQEEETKTKVKTCFNRSDWAKALSKLGQWRLVGPRGDSMKTRRVGGRQQGAQVGGMLSDGFSNCL